MPPHSQVQKAVICTPRGFCAGVEMAIKALSWMLRLFGPPVYCYHEIVHNKWVVKTFMRAGVIFIDDPQDMPSGYPLMLSAHGSAPEIVQTAHEKTTIIVNAVCPLVTKVHHEARTRAKKGMQIIYIGHAGHDEAVGTMAEAPAAMHLVQDLADLEALPLTNETPTALLAQTTLAHSEWAEIREEATRRYPSLWTPGRSDLCFATTNRQKAVRTLAPNVDLFVIIGSENSSNTQALVRVAKETGCPRAIRIEGPEDITKELIGETRTVGVTAGASAAESVVAAVVAAINPVTQESLEVTTEDEYFPLPRELRAFLRGLDTSLRLFFGETFERSRVDSSDRDVTAAWALENLSLLHDPGLHDPGLSSSTNVRQQIAGEKFKDPNTTAQ